GLIFVCFVVFSPSGLVGIWSQLERRWRSAPEEGAAMSQRKVYDGLALPEFLRPQAKPGTVLRVEGVSKNFEGIRAVDNASLTLGAVEIHALIAPNGAGKPSTSPPACTHRMAAPSASTTRRSRGRRRIGSATRASPDHFRSPTCSAVCPFTRTCACPCRRSTP